MKIPAVEEVAKCVSTFAGQVLTMLRLDVHSQGFRISRALDHDPPWGSSAIVEVDDIKLECDPHGTYALQIAKDMLDLLSTLPIESNYTKCPHCGEDL